MKFSFPSRCRANLAALFAVLTALPPVSATAGCPLTVEDTEVGSAGAIQWESCLEYSGFLGGARTWIQRLTPSVGLERGIQLSAAIPLLLLERESSSFGLGDISVAVKTRLAQESNGLPALALKGTIKTSSGDPSIGLGSGNEEILLMSSASRTLGPAALFAQAGYQWTGPGSLGSGQGSLAYGLGGDLGVAASIHLVAEMTGLWNPREERNSQMAALAGIHCAFTSHASLHAGYRWGISEDLPAWNPSLGATLSY